MAQIITAVHSSEIHILELTALLLKDHASVCAKALGNAGLMNPSDAIADNIIYHQPQFMRAHSIYQVILHIRWSKDNPDFTAESKTMDLGGEVKWKLLREIGQALYPALFSKKNTVNIWLNRLDSAAFAFGPPPPMG